MARVPDIGLSCHGLHGRKSNSESPSRLDAPIHFLISPQSPGNYSAAVQSLQTNAQDTSPLEGLDLKALDLSW
jgi:hypothetical protein